MVILQRASLHVLLARLSQMAICKTHQWQESMHFKQRLTMVVPIQMTCEYFLHLCNSLPHSSPILIKLVQDEDQALIFIKNY